MANTYPSLSVKGMIYIHSGSPQISVSSQKTTQGRRGRSEDPVYTACGLKICMGPVVCDVFKSRMHNFDGPPTTLQTEHRTRLQAWFNTYDVSSPTLFSLAWDTSIYIYTSIHLYSVRITLKVAHWMKPIRRYRDGKSEHYWPLHIIYIPPDSATCTI